jgi:hypothetical protein
MFGRRVHPTSQPSDPSKLTLFNQSMLPEDLRLPAPADPLFRIGAGLADALVSGVGGVAAGAAAYYGSGCEAVELAAAAGQGTALLLWLVRDGLADEGTRSLGKKAFGLELTYWDGTLASRGHCLARNWYYGVLPLMALHPVLDMGGTLLFFFDACSLALTQDARKVADYMFGTRVVNERPARDGRVLDMVESMEVRRLRDEIEQLAPGLLRSGGAGASVSGGPAAGAAAASANSGSSGQAAKSREPPAYIWYEDVQREVAEAANAAAEAEAAAAAAAAKAGTGSAGRAGDAAQVRAPSGASLGEVGSAASLLHPPMAAPGGFGSIFSEVRDDSADAGARAGEAGSAASGAGPGPLGEGALLANKPKPKK